MTMDFLETIDIEYRLQQQLPIQSKKQEQYFRDRFYWIVDKFKEKYIVDGQKLETDSILDEMFSSIKNNVGDLNLSKLYDFKVALACSFIAAANNFNCSLKVPTHFFQDQFLTEIDQRFHRQSSSGRTFASFALKYLINEGVDQTKAMKIIEEGINHAETCPYYNLSLEEFRLKLIDGIFQEWERLNVS